MILLYFALGLICGIISPRERLYIAVCKVFIRETLRRYRMINKLQLDKQKYKKELQRIKNPGQPH